MALTDTAARQAKPKASSYTLGDTGGLALYVDKNGSKAWHFRFSWHQKQQRISLGSYPELSLKDARQLRDQARSLVEKGIDPRQQRRDEQLAAKTDARKTFEAVANEWYDFKSPRMIKAKKGGAAQSRRYLDKDLIPALGAIPIIEVKKSDVLIPIRRIEARGALCVARKCRTWLKEIFRYAIATGYIESSPASDLDIVAIKEPPERHNPMLMPSELKDFLIALRDFKCAEYTKCAIRILLLTGVRTGELRYATRTQFDLDAALWTIPADIVKQLRKVIRGKDGDKVPPYLVPLSHQAVSTIKRVCEITGNFPLLIPGRIHPLEPISDGTINMALKRLGYEGRLTGHGIRATISTALNEMGYNEDWIYPTVHTGGRPSV